MTPMSWSVLVLLVVIALLVIAVIHQAERAEDGLPRPSRKQIKQWRRDRLELPPVVAGNRRRP